MKSAALKFNTVSHCYLISHGITPVDENKDKNIWEYKVGNNGNIANFVCLWKTRIALT